MNTKLAESGLNLSVGQRQLVCLARAILRKNQILILDKATSNVDPRTGELIQKKIHEKFADCTVLTITHRLSTVIDCERILVLDSGRLKQYNRPYDLLKNTDSLFYKMVQKLGKAEASALTERAKQTQIEFSAGMFIRVAFGVNTVESGGKKRDRVEGKIKLDHWLDDLS
ncbi:multidrug resistance-associated protein 4-like [Bos indicus x Bos taurus]|uniref:multidrug resistance-associated protein 4-like n=1 Tax=Bos indicus x Bos taurus TaxID=30522 RepID=UPI000F7D4D98|nr:multidrug resistance-associated protein 4-like [Bos indicus x Bos taurus]